MEQEISGAELVELMIKYTRRPLASSPVRLWCGECGVEFETAEGLWTHCCQS